MNKQDLTNRIDLNMLSEQNSLVCRGLAVDQKRTMISSKQEGDMFRKKKKREKVTTAAWSRSLKQCQGQFTSRKHLLRLWHLQKSCFHCILHAYTWRREKGKMPEMEDNTNDEWREPGWYIRFITSDSVETFWTYTLSTWTYFNTYSFNI